MKYRLIHWACLMILFIALCGVYAPSFILSQDESAEKGKDKKEIKEEPLEDDEVFPKPKEIEQEMILIEEGAFIRGSKNDDKKAEVAEMPQYEVTLNAFYIDKYEVSNAMYKKFVVEASYTAPRHWVSGEIPFGRENYPVTYVSWDDAAAYAKWAGKRLPTEAEWEKAARGKEGSVYPWGNDYDKLNCRNGLSNIRDTASVNEYDTGKSASGCYNMSGNVWEWVADRYDWRYYRSTPKPDKNPTGPSESDKDTVTKYPDRVIKGGSWGDYEEDLRAAKRSGYPADYKSFRIGFRCAKDGKTE
jgi:iron(II)-dependent oxidoreductase